MNRFFLLLGFLVGFLALMINEYVAWQYLSRFSTNSTNYFSPFYILLAANLITFFLISLCALVLYSSIKKLEAREAQIFKLEKMNSLILDNSKELILTLDPEGKITTINKAVAKLSATSNQIYIGSYLTTFLIDEDHKSLLEVVSKKYKKTFHHFSDILQLARQNQISADIVWTLKGKNPKKISLAASLSPLFDIEQKFIGFLFEGSDITQRVEWETELREAQKKAELANKAKSEFLARMSHDLRTPLTAIIGFSNLLQQNREEHFDAKDLTFLSRIEQNGMILLSMIENIMDLEKIEEKKVTINLKPTDLRVLIDKIFKQVELNAKSKGIELILDTPKGLTPFSADDEKLLQILTNLIANALKFTEQGYVKVVVQKDGKTNKPSRIDVSDTGIGISPLDIPKLFEPFFQIQRPLNKTHGGSGLGLSICKSLSELLGYKLTVESEEGLGSTFSLIL